MTKIVLKITKYLILGVYSLTFNKRGEADATKL